MINLKQNLLNAWVKCLTCVLSALGFTACDNVFNSPDLYGCPPEDYKQIHLEVKGNIVNEAGQNIKSTVAIKVTDDGVNYKPFQTVKTNDYGFYQFYNFFSEEYKGVRIVVSDDKNYYHPDSSDVKFDFSAESYHPYILQEFNFTLTPRIEF